MDIWGIGTWSSATKARIAGNLLQAFALLAINAWCSSSSYYGSLTFTSPYLNRMAIGLMLLLPVLSNVLLWLATIPQLSPPPLPTPRLLQQARWGAMALIPLSAFCLLQLVVGIADPPKPESGVFESSRYFVCNVPAGGPPVRVYSGGPYGCLVQQERTLIPGLLWITPLFQRRFASSIDVAALDRHHLRCTFTVGDYHPYGDPVVVENP